MDDRLLRRLLEAEPAELDGSTDTETARIVRSDPGARAAARTILSALQEADAALSSIATDAQPELSSGMVRSVSRRPGTPSFSARRGRLWAAGLAAAALAVFAIATHDGEPVPSTPTGTDPLSVTAQLQASSSRSFAVFATDNPDMAIMWLFDEEER